MPVLIGHFAGLGFAHGLAVAVSLVLVLVAPICPPLLVLILGQPLGLWAVSPVAVLARLVLVLAFLLSLIHI